MTQTMPASLRILSNLTDRAMVKARCVIPIDRLGSGGYDGGEVRDAVVLAAEFGEADPYRAVTNNKGVTVFDKSGKQVENIPTHGENWTGNVCFGGKDRQTLFITASKGFYAIKMRVKGAGSQ